MKIIATFILLIFCSGCRRHEVDYVQIVNRINLEYSKLVYEKDKLILAGSGGRMMGDIQCIVLSFNSFRQPDISEARQLVVSKVDEFLLLLNNCCDIRPFLNNYPFEEKNFDLKIGFVQPSGEFVIPPNIAYVSVMSGFIFYSVYDSQKERLERVHSESFEEARRLID